MSVSMAWIYCRIKSYNGFKIRALDVVLTYLVFIIYVVSFSVVMLRVSRSRGW